MGYPPRRIGTRGQLLCNAVLLMGASMVSITARAQSPGCETAAYQSTGVRVVEQSNQHFLLARLGDMTDWSLVLQARGGIESPVVSSDGQRLAYLIEEFGRWRAYLQRLATGYRVEVAMFAGKPRQICFSEDGGTLVVIDAAGAADVISLVKAWASLDV